MLLRDPVLKAVVGAPPLLSTADRFEIPRPRTAGQRKNVRCSSRPNPRNGAYLLHHAGEELYDLRILVFRLTRIYTGDQKMVAAKSRIERTKIEEAPREQRCSE